MDCALVLMVALAAALGAGASAPGDCPEPYEHVVAPAKGLTALASLLSAPYGRSVKRSGVLAFVRSKALDDGGYKVIDEVTRREALLQKARDEAGRAERESTELVCHALKSRLRLALAFGRASVAKRMALPENKSYSMQAMEAAIDATRDAAQELETLEKSVPPGLGEVTSLQLWTLHRRLLDIWETSKKRDDLGLIKRLDLPKLVREFL